MVLVSKKFAFFNPCHFIDKIAKIIDNKDKKTDAIELSNLRLQNKIFKLNIPILINIRIKALLLTENKMKDKKANAYFMYIGSMLIFGTIGIFRRYIPLPSGMLAFTRGLLGALFLYSYIKLKGIKFEHNIGFRNLLFFALAGAIMGINWILLFEAYNYTSVSTATLSYYMQPTIVIILSPFVFKEKLTVKKIACAVMAVAGMVFVSGITEGVSLRTSDIRGILFGLGAAVFYASVVILNKKIRVEDAYVKTIIQMLSAAIVLIPYLLMAESFQEVKLTSYSVLMIFVVGIVHTGVAYVLYFGSIGGLKAQSVAILSYIDPVSALILSAIILHEHITIYGIIGAILIIGSAIFSELE